MLMMNFNLFEFHVICVFFCIFKLVVSFFFGQLQPEEPVGFVPTGPRFSAFDSMNFNSLPSFTEFYRVLPSFTGFYRVFIRFFLGFFHVDRFGVGFHLFFPRNFQVISWLIEV